MENKSSFKFTLLKVQPFKKGDTRMARLVVYCEYGFLVTLFTTEEKAKTIQEKSKIKNNDITEYVSVYYDTNDNIFKYYIEK